MTITWNSNENATSQVEFGTTASYGASSALDSTLVTGHSRTLSGLNPSTTYHFRVVSKDAANNTATSADNTFTTTAPPDTSAPTLSAITAGSLTPTSAVISWSTGELSTSQVEFGPTTAYGALSTLDTTLVTSHTRPLNGLSASTTYHYRVISKDASNNAATSGDNIFTTPDLPDTTAPVLSGIAAGSLSNNSATISWTTNEPADTQVQFGTTSAYGSSTSLNSSLSTSHSQSLTGLSASTTYHFRVISKDAANNAATSGDNTFTTPAAPDTTPPTFSGIAAGSLSNSSAVIHWTTNEIADTQVQFGTTTAYGSITPLNSTLSISHSQGLTGLQPSTLYHYRVLSQDAAGNAATSGDNTFTTTAAPDTTVPVLSGITVGSLSNSAATISWTTNEAADSQVQFGTTAAYGASTARDGALTTGHSQNLTGLSASTTYHFRVLSSDAAGNLSTSGDNTFTTAALPDTTPPVLSGIAAGNLTATSAQISWSTNEVATSQVEYGATTAYGALSVLDTTLVTGHTRTLSSLNPSTTYHYRVISKDATNHTAFSGDNTFTTAAAPDSSGPVLALITASDLRANQVTISWGTDEPATTQIEYGETVAYGTLTTLNATLLNSHSQTVTNLQNNTTYHYRVRSADALGNLSVSSDQTFTTTSLIDTTPPADVQSFTALPGNNQVTLDWVNPSDSDFVGVHVVYRTDRFPTDLNDGTVLGDFSGQPGESVSTVHAGLETNTTYYYSASSYDRSGNYQHTAHASASLAGITPSVSSAQSSAGGGGGGGCTMVSPTEGQSRGPLDAAELFGLIGLIVIRMVRKGRMK
ncbi:MAG: fibronectin type III domain-containing protein [Nitrospirae bacterium]|nr:fibronectin type III domain-containing protein [Candidatus Manganitrophaceae bacterium]